jgi:hypothetical protein
MPYDFEKFLDRMIGKSYPEILIEAEREADGVERTLTRVRGARERREMGGGQYVAKIGQFLFFMRHGIKPGGVDEFDFGSYRRVVASLVDRGEMKPSALEIFDEKA